MTIKKNKKLKFEVSPLASLIILLMFVVFASFALFLVEFQGDKATIVNSSLNEGQKVVETTLSTVKNALTTEGMEKLFSFLSSDLIASTITKIIFVGISLGLLETSGLSRKMFQKLNKVKARYLIYITVIISFLLSFLGPQIMILLVPMFALVYKHSVRNPNLGIYTVFISFNVGYGFSFLTKNIDYIIGNFTQLAANVERNINYTYSPNSVIFLNLVGIVMISLLVTVMIYKFVYPKTNKIIVEEIEQKTHKWKLTLIVSIILILLMSYGLLLGLPSSGFLLDHTKGTYALKIFSDSSMFSKYFVYLISIIIVIASIIYGKINETINDSFEVSRAIGSGLEGYERIFPIVILSTLVIMLFNWTNITEVLMVNIVDIFGVLQFSGIPLVITFILITIIGGFLMPFDYMKWSYLSPIIVPLFMRTNMTPDYAQMVFVLFTGIGSTLSIFSIYLFLTIGHLKRNSDREVRISEVYSTLVKPLFIIILFVILFVLSWYLIGLPIGPRTFTTM
jgi:aminobenzoyl-glutamate transport protein